MLLDSSKFFSENGTSHEKSDFTDYIFKDLNYKKIEQEISFYRSTFARAQITNCTFYKNAFGRSDFISASIISSEFENVSFGSCLFKNTYFERTFFQNNRYSGVAIQYSYFKKCIFRDEDITTNMYCSEFEECTFINCRFNKSSLDRNSFIKCEMINVDLSECTADNLRFDACKLRDVFLGYGIWTTYLFKNLDIRGFNFKRRGDIVPQEEVWAEPLLDNLYKSGMYFEYLNCLILFKNCSDNDVLESFKNVVPLVIKQSPLIRKNNLTKILEMVLYYQNSEQLSLSLFKDIYDYLSSLNWYELPIDEALKYSSILFQLSEILNDFKFDLSYIYSVPANKLAIAEFHINTLDRVEAIQTIESLYEICNQDLCDSYYDGPLFEVVQEEKGSVILTIVGYATLTLLISFIAKKTYNNIASIKVQHAMKKKIINLTKKAKSNEQLKEIIKTSEELDLIPSKNDEKSVSKLSLKLLGSSIISIAVSFFKNFFN